MTGELGGGDVFSLGVLDQAALTLGLDFANTGDLHVDPNPNERFTSYEAAVGWAEQAGILSASQAAGLAARARARPEGAAKALQRIIALREAVYRIFSAVAHDREPDPGDIQALHAELGVALVHLRLIAREDQPFAWAWAGIEDDLASLLWPVARATAALLTSPQLSRVRECAGDPCDWLFLDHSKNGSRRWCDMSECGNRAKARRYRERRKVLG
ncbi:MAG: hypothetical protein A2133_05035 [Actinobacteria bacterium RBG_16_64_13]|nr:MAG: hypothetical protein A2133_05035 [Actinobacteria bacterium RBG_16_64_13]